MNDLFNNYQENEERADRDLAQSIKLSECTHPVSTVLSDDDIYAIECDECGKQFTEQEWTDYIEERDRKASNG